MSLIQRQPADARPGTAPVAGPMLWSTMNRILNVMHRLNLEPTTFGAFTDTPPPARNDSGDVEEEISKKALTALQRKRKNWIRANNISDSELMWNFGASSTVGWGVWFDVQNQAHRETFNIDILSKVFRMDLNSNGWIYFKYFEGTTSLENFLNSRYRRMSNEVGSPMQPLCFGSINYLPPEDHQNVLDDRDVADNIDEVTDNTDEEPEQFQQLRDMVTRRYHYFQENALNVRIGWNFINAEQENSDSPTGWGAKSDPDDSSKLIMEHFAIWVRNDLAFGLAIIDSNNNEVHRDMMETVEEIENFLNQRYPSVPYT